MKEEEKSMQSNSDIVGSGQLESISDLLDRSLDKIDAIHYAKTQMTGISTGFADLDEYTNGFQRGELHVIASRPSMGKSTFLYNLLSNGSSQETGLVVLFSTGIPSDMVTRKLLSEKATIAQNKLRYGGLEPEEWKRLSTSVSDLTSKKLFIDDTYSLSVDEMRKKTHELVHKKGEKIDIIAIDDVSILKNDNVNFSEVAASLRKLAMEFNASVIVLSQVNRDLEFRENKRPILSDLGDDSGFEKHADIVLFIYRDEVYDWNSEDKGIAEIIIGKNRNGPIGTTRLKFSGQYSRFENY